MRKIRRLTVYFILFIFTQTGFSETGNKFQYHKIDPALAAAIKSPQYSPLMLAKAPGIKYQSTDRVIVLIKTTLTKMQLAELGVRVYSKIGPIANGSTDIINIPRLSNINEIEYIQASRLVKIHNDVSMPEIGIPAISTNYGSTGRGVIIGVIDTGIDWQHADFRNTDGSTRILALLDFSDPGNIDNDMELDGPDQYGGTLYTESEINNALNGMGNVRENDVVGHGTHVAGTAAGNGLATGFGVPAETFVGAAPEADLVIVKATRTQGSLNFVDSDYINAIAFIDSFAAAHGKPYVINLSLGGSNGPHDGRDLAEQAIDGLVGSGVPGKAIVVSAGNDGEKNIHSGGNFNIDTTEYEIGLNIPQYTPNTDNQDDYLVLEGWYSSTDNYQIKLITPGRNVIGPVLKNREKGVNTDEGAIYMSNAYGGPSNLNGQNQIQIQIYDFVKEKYPKSGDWVIVIEGESGRYDLWLAGSSMNAQLTSNADNSMIVGTPGTAFNAITVGSYITKAQWTDLDGNKLHNPTILNKIGSASGFSSSGPTRDLRIKPEISAPGELITASYSADASPESQYTMFNSGNSSLPNAYIAEDGNHALSQGTSFAAPHVAGTIALMFEQNPNLDAIQIRNAIIETARDTLWRENLPNYKSGYGKLDAFQALKYLIDNQPENKFTVSIFQNPAFTQYIDFYLIAKYQLQSLPNATVTINNQTSSSITLAKLDALTYKGEYVFSNDGNATLNISATVAGESETQITKYFSVKLLKALAGGSVNFNKISLVVPRNTLKNDSYFTIMQQEKDLPDRSVLVSAPYKIMPVDYQFDRLVKIVFRYDETLISSVDENKLVIARLTGNRWNTLPAEIDKNKNEVTAFTNQLGVFGLLINRKTDDAAPVDQFILNQNYPNPFNARTTISYYLPKSTQVKIEVFNMNGKQVTALFDGIRQAGPHQIIWDGTDTSNRSLASGLYFCKISTTANAITKKMLYLK